MSTACWLLVAQITVVAIVLATVLAIVAIAVASHFSTR